MQQGPHSNWQAQVRLHALTVDASSQTNYLKVGIINGLLF